MIFGQPSDLVQAPSAVLQACQHIFGVKGTAGDVLALLNAGARLAVALNEYGSSASIKATGLRYRDALLIVAGTFQIPETTSTESIDPQIAAQICTLLESTYALAQTETAPRIQETRNDLDEVAVFLTQHSFARLYRFTFWPVAIGATILVGLSAVLARRV